MFVGSLKMPRTLTSQSQFDEISTFQSWEGLLTFSDDFFHFVPFGTNDSFWDVELFVLFNLDFVTTSEFPLMRLDIFLFFGEVGRIFGLVFLRIREGRYSLVDSNWWW